jgi:succinate-semialdehyde dehydrogenase/glutarate-semialdehyde dehydrogenase
MHLVSVNPATEEEVARYDPLDDSALDARIARSAAAFGRHRNRAIDERAERLAAAGDRLEAHARTYAETMTREMGKPVDQAVAEAEKCAWVCRYFAEHAADFLADEPVDTEATKSYVTFEPLGPILAVMPWNFPFWQVFRFAAPALMAGNTVLLKHAPNVTGCALQIEELLRDAGFDDDEFQTLVISEEQAQAVLEDPRVRAATLTGSVGAGQAVGGQAARHVKPSVLELGGSDPFIVCADADLDRALDVGLTARMQNNSQSCIAAKRFILEAPIAETFTERFVDRMEGLTIGDPMDEDVDLGPMARPDLRDQVHDQVQRTVDQGATCATGGHKIDRMGYFYAPTVLTGVEADMVPFEEEIFGPVAALTVADDTEHAVALANNTRFGLGGAVFTEDRERGERLARRLDAGGAFVNTMTKSDPRLPFGGIKDSGYGRELSRYGLREFVNVKTIWVE